MKTYNRIILIVIFCMNFLFATNAQDAANLTAGKRDSLLSLAKEVILKFGPDYYREYKQPEIIYKQYPSADKMVDKRNISWADRYYYRVTFLYDKTQETLEWDYAAQVYIWADTFEPRGVMFGCNVGINVPEGDWRNSSIEPIAYQESIYPAYPEVIQIVTPDSLQGQPWEVIQEYTKKQAEIVRKSPEFQPLNKDELLKRNWEFRNGEWVKTGPDVPPHKRKQQF